MRTFYYYDDGNIPKSGNVFISNTGTAHTVPTKDIVNGKEPDTNEGYYKLIGNANKGKVFSIVSGPGNWINENNVVFDGDDINN
jgi:hypothetical protein